MARHLSALVVVSLVCGSARAARAQETLFSTEGEQAGERLGYLRSSFALPDVDGDGFRDLLVGAARHDGPNGVDSGRVRTLSGRTQAVLQTWDGEGANDGFGLICADALDVDGDGVHDVAIAASQYPNGAFQGKVYIYSGATGALIWSWTGEEAGDDFGTVRGVGDATGDGVPDIMVAAIFYNANSNKTNEGKVYLYSGADGTLVNSWVGVAGAFLGFRAGALGFDVDGDGANDFAVGAFEQNSPSPNPGHVYVYSGFSQTPLVTLSGANDGDCQGYIEDAEDVDGDGVPDLLVGSPFFNGGLGVQYIYSGKDWSVLRTWYGTSDMIVGAGSRMAGDVDGDGIGDVLIGSTVYDGPAGQDTGIVRLVSGETGRPFTAWYGEQADEHFGFPSHNAGDLDGDGILDQIVDGILFDGAAGIDCGKVYAFQGNDLYLNVEPSVATGGDTVTITTTAGKPGNFVIDVVTELDGVAIFLLLTPVLTFDSNGELEISGDVPLGLGAHDVKLQSFAIGRSGKLIDSGTRTLTLQ